jgi:hypothetical protein
MFETGWIECSRRGDLEHVGKMDCFLIETKLNMKKEKTAPKSTILFILGKAP